jgi:hypothetical protein
MVDGLPRKEHPITPLDESGLDFGRAEKHQQNERAFAPANDGTFFLK